MTYPSKENMLVHHFLEHSAQRFKDKTALVVGDQRLTYHELDQAADRLARFLVSIGVKRQDRVIIWLDNTAEAVISIFGVLKAGAIFVFLNPLLKTPKLSYIFKDSGAVALIAHTGKKATVMEATAQAQDLKHILWCGPPLKTQTTPSAAFAFHPWEDALSENPSCTLPRTIDIDLATIIYTSGSTGEPKGVVSAHCNVVAAARSISTYLKNTEDDIILSALPLSFDYGLYQILMAALFGGTVVLEKSFMFPYKVLEKIDQEQVTGFPIVPTMAALLLQLDLARFDLSHLRYLSNTAAALPVAYIQKLQSLLPHVQIFSMYGLTECKRVSYLPPEYLVIKPTSVGIPMPNEEVFIVDENGQEVAPGQIGELVVRGANVMQGYWNSPETTARTFRPGRYRGETLLYSGDLFKRDEEGFLYFVGRKDDMIKTKGERVSPKEVENMLCSLEGISEAAVIGVPDDILGQAIKAFIVRSSNAALTTEDIQRHCTKNLEPFLVPKHVQFIESLPKTNSGKIDKKSLR
jgi:acyl-CoA ligase (AMP-forming) (exosortase A-associated)